ncbi:uncharacterized protein UBRO_20756 [Ustilago bromivora]|uniref:Uncharacterized protein n=1 Tax=Ustilago bromivora TaxID=307758 RepID=A0A1K0G6Q1_9BASI|nr:uncharacterized protein UBRO_20756 [Ustilago bromivora]
MEPAGEEQEHNMRQLLPSRVFEEVEAEIGLKGPKRLITAKFTQTSSYGGYSALVATTPTMESIATQGLLELTRIFQPLDKELRDIHAKTPFELKDKLWYKDR